MTTLKTVLLEQKGQKTGCKNILELIGREDLQTVSIEKAIQEFPSKREAEKRGKCRVMNFCCVCVCFNLIRWEKFQDVCLDAPGNDPRKRKK